MPHSEAQAWWADVQHVREAIERRRAGLESPTPRDAGMETRFERRAAAPSVPLDDLDWTQASATRGESRVEHVGRSLHAEAAPSRARRPGPDLGDRGASRGRRNTDHLEPDTRGDRARGPRHHTAEPEAAGPDDERFAAVPAPTPSRRTVEITGRTVAAPPLPRLVEVERRRPPRRTVERVGPRPDRVALWAVLLGFFLILVAATSSRAATPAVHGHAGAAVALHAPAR